MTQIALAAAPPTLIKDEPDKCPFCHKAPHDFASKKESEDKKIVSKPSGLGNLSIPGTAPGKWGRARHHIIPAIQCFAMVKRLARMAMSVGYDINAPRNGIGLPTIKNKYICNGITDNFGNFSKEEKKQIAFKMMDESGKQWHVGNHHYVMNKEETSPENMDDEGEIDHLPYDQEVIKKLIDELDQWDQTDLCQSEDDFSEEAKECMNKISDDIREKLDNFQYGGSKPFYVSETARQWAQKKH